jgi:site-specific recombinase XerD
MLGKLAEAYREGIWDAWSQTPADFFQADRSKVPKRVGETVARFMVEKEEMLARSTLNAYRSYTALLVSVLGSQTFLERIEAADVDRFVRATGGSGRAPSQGSKHQRLIVAQSFFRWAVEQGACRANPTEKALRPGKPHRIPKAVIDTELYALLAAIPDTRAWTRPLFEFAGLTGLRLGELGRLRWEDVDTERRLITLHTQKNGKAQTQPIPRAAVAVLSRVKPASDFVFTAPRAYTERRVESWMRDVENVFKEAKDAAGIERAITPHGLRHFFCTKLAEAGANAFTIAAAARHADVQTSARYVSISNQHLSRELDAVFG